MGRLLDEDTVIKVLERWQKAFRENSHYVSASDLSLVVKDVRELPPAQPEPTDINVKEAVYNLAEKIGIHQLFALTVELRGEPIQPEPHEGHWIEGKIYRDVIECNCSECGQLMTTAATVRMNYCPNCGAKMTISTK